MSETKYAETIVISGAGLNIARMIGMVIESQRQGLIGTCDNKPRNIFATSAGCYIALAIALNIDLEELCECLLSKMSGRKFNHGFFITSIIKGLLTGYLLDTKIREEIIDIIYTKANVSKDLCFEDLDVHLNFNVVDLDSGKMYNLGYFTTPKCPIREAILASTAIPALFPPQKLIIKGKVHRLVDGGLCSYITLSCLDTCTPYALVKDPLYNGTPVPCKYDLAFCIYNSIGKLQKMDLLSVISRMLHILQNNTIQWQLDSNFNNSNIVLCVCDESLSYFEPLPREKLQNELNAGFEEVISHLNLYLFRQVL
jgi:hypothetical protein